MALLGREFIAVPDEKKRQIIFKWHDVSIRRFSKVIVEPDQQAVFVNKGQVIGTLPPGRHDVDADELPFLGAFIDVATGGKAYRAELFFVGTREYTDNPFGVRIVRMGNFDINLADEDEANLKAFAKDSAYSKMAGNFGEYARGEALLGAGEGMAKGGAGAGNAFIGVGMGVGQQVTPGAPP